MCLMFLCLYTFNVFCFCMLPLNVFCVICLMFYICLMFNVFAFIYMCFCRKAKPALLPLIKYSCGGHRCETNNS